MPFLLICVVNASLALPRVRLGVMVSVIVLIVCTFCSRQVDRMATTIRPMLSLNLLRRVHQRPLLRSRLTNRGRWRFRKPSSLRSVSDLPNRQTTHCPARRRSGHRGSPEPETWSSLPGAPDMFGDFVLADRGILAELA